MLFHVIPDAYATLRSRGVFRQSKLYMRGKQLYAAYGGGYVGLRRDYGTTVPHVRWEYVEIEELGEIVEEKGASGALTFVKREGV